MKPKWLQKWIHKTALDRATKITQKRCAGTRVQHPSTLHVAPSGEKSSRVLRNTLKTTPKWSPKWCPNNNNMWLKFGFKKCPNMRDPRTRSRIQQCELWQAPAGQASLLRQQCAGATWSNLEQPGATWLGLLGSVPILIKNPIKVHCILAWASWALFLT